ncbi:hypothetical protein Dimus_029371 [Dionaea muscipula]
MSIEAYAFLLFRWYDFVCCPLFSRCKDNNSDYPLLYGSIVQSIASLLKAMSDLYVESSKYSRNVQTETDLLQVSASDSPTENFGPFERSRSGIGVFCVDTIEYCGG